VVGSCEHENGPSGFITGKEFLDQLKNYALHKRDYASWIYVVSSVTL
jgi:hypothetical protein